MKHTKSISGRTHRLEHKSRHPVPQVMSVVLRYASTPQFDDQVQGDLIRKLRREYDYHGAIGVLPVTVDPMLQDGTTQLSMDYLRGYRDGLRMTKDTKDVLAAVEAEIERREELADIRIEASPLLSRIFSEPKDS